MTDSIRKVRHIPSCSHGKLLAYASTRSPSITLEHDDPDSGVIALTFEEATALMKWLEAWLASISLPQFGDQTGDWS